VPRTRRPTGSASPGRLQEAGTTQISALRSRLGRCVEFLAWVEAAGIEPASRPFREMTATRDFRGQNGKGQRVAVQLVVPSSPLESSPVVERCWQASGHVSRRPHAHVYAERKVHVFSLPRIAPMITPRSQFPPNTTKTVMFRASSGLGGEGSPRTFTQSSICNISNSIGTWGTAWDPGRRTDE